MDFDSPLPPDPYAALGLTKEATAAAIKSSYRKLALKYHPDKVTDGTSVDEFHRIQQAYDIVGDEDKRARYDALIRLSDLRRQNEELRPSRGVRTAAYDVRTPTAARPVYTTARPSKFEERRPKYYDDDDEYTRPSASKYSDYEYPGKRQPTAVPLRSERLRPDPRDAEEKKRAERRREREAEVRDGRSRKYDISEDNYRWEEERRRRIDEEREQRRVDDLRRERASTSTERKYVDHEAGAQQYMQDRTRPAAEVRPSASRRPSTREVPLAYASVRRSQAPTKDKELRDREREREREREIRERNQREKERLDQDRAEDRRRAEAKARERDAEREPVAAAARTRNVENVEPFERRPPALATQKTSPTMAQPSPAAREPRDPRLPRSYTENLATLHSMADATPAPAFNRVSSMPTQPSNSSARRAKDSIPAQSSKLREPVMPTDSGYSSPSHAVPDAFGAHAPPPNAHSGKEKRFHYPSDSTDSTESAKRSPYHRTELREPGSSSRRARSSSRERLTTAEKMAHLATGSSRSTARPSTSYNVEAPFAAIRPSLLHAATSRAVPLSRSSRSPDHGLRRTRSRDRDADRGRERRGREADYGRSDKLYGERGPGISRGESYNSSHANSSPKVSYVNGGKPYTLDNVNFGQGRRGSASGRGPSDRERGYDNFQKPGYYRSSTLPVY